MVVVDCETTGLVPGYHEVISIALIKLKANYDIDKDIMPFNTYIIPEHEDRIDPEALRLNKIKLSDVKQNGMPKENVVQLLTEWHSRLRCGPLVVLAQNWPFDKIFIMEMFDDDELFRSIFHYHFRDTCSVANFINDRYMFFRQEKLFQNVKLKTLAEHFHIDYENAHDALQDCIITAQAYKKLLNLELPRY